MKLLLVAYDFPPIPSPQALRWAYFVRELATAGHHIEVIAPDVPGYGAGGLPILPPQVIVHRVNPGRLTRILLGRRHVSGSKVNELAVVTEKAASINQQVVDGKTPLNWKGRLRSRVEGTFSRGGLNWKGRLAERVKKMVSARVFPDYRAEWIPHAVEKMDQILLELQPDAIIVSHEPACSLPVGLAAAKRGVPLVVDMGDPVLAPYTPEKWRKAAFQLEGDVCRNSVMVSVTTQAAADVLMKRHRLAPAKFVVATQGFDSRFERSSVARMVEFSSEYVEMLYTGSFYSFRRAESILDAVLAVPGVRLTIATISAPKYLLDYAESSNGRIRLVGFMPHVAALVAQRECDVLLNIANVDPVQVPGKVFEYLGARKPILHIRGDKQDATGAMLLELGAGWDVATSEDGLPILLRDLVRDKQSGVIAQYIPTAERTEVFSWSHIAAIWASRLREFLEAASVARPN